MGNGKIEKLWFRYPQVLVALERKQSTRMFRFMLMTHDLMGEGCAFFQAASANDRKSIKISHVLC